MFVLPAQGGRPRLLVEGARDARWSPNGRSVLTLWEHMLIAVPVDGGSPATVATGLVDAHPSRSPTSEQVAIAGVTWDSDRRYHLYLADPGSGVPLRRLHDHAATAAPAWSPDGKAIAFADFEGAIRVMDLATGETTTLTRIDGLELFGLTWSPDGSRIAFVASRRHEGD